MFLKPAVKNLAPVIGVAVGAKSKNPQVGQVTTNNSRSKSGGKVLSLFDINGNGLRLSSL